MKTCNYCHLEKPTTEFYKKPTSRDGLFWWCRDCHKEKMKAKYYELASGSEYRAAEQIRVCEFWRNNPQKRAEADAKRRASRLQRTPVWLSEDDFWLIEQAYELAQLRTQIFGFQWHVDHIVPLQGELVSGLHVPHNLQVIPARDNLSKSNKFAPT